MGARSQNCRDALWRLICGTLLLLAQEGRVQGRRMPWESWRVGAQVIDVWGEGAGAAEGGGGAADVEVVVHARRHLLQTSAQYCVALASADEDKLQDALNWACGPQGSGGGVDCDAIQESGSCYSPNTVRDHASYAFDYYYVQQNGAANSCDFGGLATTTPTNPSSGSCVYPSLSSGVTSPSPSSNFSSSSPVNSTFGSPLSSSTTNAALAVGPSLIGGLGPSVLMISFLAAWL